MANEQNLIPNTERTPSELREMTHNGGVASGAARRRKRDMREAADLLLSLKATPKQRADMAKLGIDADDADMQMAMLVAQLQQAMKGNTKAAAFLYSVTRDAENSENIDTEDTDSYFSEAGLE